MEVVPTDDGDDDGVMWLRCPQCHGFLPRLGSALAEDEDTPAATKDPTDAADGDVDEVADTATAPSAPDTDEVPETEVAEFVTAGDSVSDDLAPELIAVAGDETVADVADLPEADSGSDTEKKNEDEAPAEDWSAELAAMDVTKAVPYRPGGSYALGDVVQHLAWDDCGVVVGEDVLPGRRRVIKVAFEKSGVHRLIVESGRS